MAGSRVPALHVTACRVSTSTYDEAALVPNPSNMKEYNPAAPNGSYDLTKPDSKGHGSSIECVQPVTVTGLAAVLLLY